MEFPYSPPVLCLSDDENDNVNQPERFTSYGSSIRNTSNENLPHKKRKLINSDIRVSTSTFQCPKRQRNDNYLTQRQTTRNLTNYEPETIVIDPDDPIIEDEESHSFGAFDWTNDVRPSPKTFSNPIQPIPQLAIPVQQHRITHIAKHHSDQIEPHPLIPLIRQHDRLIQSSRNKSVALPMPATSSPPLPLPLPTPTSAFTRPSIQRVPPVKTVRMPYVHSASSSSLMIPHRIEPSFSSAFHSTSTIHTPSTTEISHQTVNGNAVLSAFHDSKFYRCNICRFKTVQSSALLQHLFTHIFFCRQCSFYTYSQHELYQHVFEKHNTNIDNDFVDPKKLDVLYVTRCQDGTFALCMDSSTSKITIPLPSSLTNMDEQPNTSKTVTNDKKSKRQPPKKKAPKPRTTKQKAAAILSKNSDVNSQPSTSAKEILTPSRVQQPRYVVMKHRRCFSGRQLLCLHSLTLEYNICREHTCRRIYRTQPIVKRLKPTPKMDSLIFINEIASCLKTIVNEVVNMEDNRFSHIPICQLPNNIINLVFPTDDIITITNIFKLNNKYEKILQENEHHSLENILRTNNQHVFVLSASETNQVEQSIISDLHTSITNSDSEFLKTPLPPLSISYDNTARFLKGTITTSMSTITLASKVATNSDPVHNMPSIKPGQSTNSSLTLSVLNRNSNSVTSSKSKVLSMPNVIIID